MSAISLVAPERSDAAGEPLSLVAERPRLQRRCAVGDDGAVASRLFASRGRYATCPKSPPDAMRRRASIL
jgi:hypothetical protein